MGKPRLKLIGEDGNVFNILSLTRQAGRHAGWSNEKIEAVMGKAMSGDYHHVLSTMMDYFDVY